MARSKPDPWIQYAMGASVMLRASFMSVTETLELEEAPLRNGDVSHVQDERDEGGSAVAECAGDDCHADERGQARVAVIMQDEGERDDGGAAAREVEREFASSAEVADDADEQGHDDGRREEGELQQHFVQHDPLVRTLQFRFRFRHVLEARAHILCVAAHVNRKQVPLTCEQRQVGFIRCDVAQEIVKGEWRHVFWRQTSGEGEGDEEEEEEDDKVARDDRLRQRHLRTQSH